MQEHAMSAAEPGNAARTLAGVRHIQQEGTNLSCSIMNMTLGLYESDSHVAVHKTIGDDSSTVWHFESATSFCYQYVPHFLKPPQHLATIKE